MIVNDLANELKRADNIIKRLSQLIGYAYEDDDNRVPKRLRYKQRQAIILKAKRMEGD